MYLILDTETSGFPSKGLPKENPKQARIVQLAWIILDKHFKEVSCFKSLIRSNGKWTISSGAQQAHGISQQECDNYGLPIENVMASLESALVLCQKVVAHNLKFDSQLIDIERVKFESDWKADRYVCTMQLMTPICKLPSQRMTYKWPKLQEAYLYCFNEEFKGAHDALNDVRATGRVFRWLVERGHVTV